MIVVITIDHDPLTSAICLWLLHHSKPFKIFSGQDVVEFVAIGNKSIILKNITRGYEIDLNNVSKILYRQGGILLSSNTNKIGDSNLSEYLTQENRILQQYLHYQITQIDHLGHPQLSDLNKLIVLEKACKFKLLVPEYILTTKKSDLLPFFHEHSKLITKTILPAFTYQNDNNDYFSYTEVFDQQDLETLKDNFHPTFFQKLILKKFDIRTFYLKSKFYSIAIVSQNNSQTQIDFREYDRELPNRQVPFNLPKDIEGKLHDLITDLDLNYCSIDFIYGQDKNFYFLEINPIGQFGNVSYFGNYHLEKLMAETL